MTIEKSKVLVELRRRGLHDRADWVDRILPDQIDTDRNAGLLRMLNLDVASLIEEEPPAVS